MSSKLPNMTIETLGPRRIPSPLGLGNEPGDDLADYLPDDQRVLYHVSTRETKPYLDRGEDLPCFEAAGPREHLYFDPSKLKAGIVTCGGLCPGLNNVIRGIVLALHFGYGVRTILGFKYGYEGLVPKYKHPVIELTPDAVVDIHRLGGTVLGTSRGSQEASEMVDTLERLGLGILFCIGGDGTMRGALAVHEEIRKRGLRIGVVGVPKTIDNDIMYIEKSFGFETAFSVACEAIRAAHVEATGARNGIGLVKLMGRNSGYIAANAALAERDVNLVLVPEQDFDLDAPSGLLAVLERRILDRHHAVIVVAEGAGQRHLQASSAVDPSGNVRLSDIGVFLRDRIREHFVRKGTGVDVKYIDPSYIIRSVPANPSDAVYCGYLSQHAAHAGMAGKTGLAVGQWNGQFTHVPLSAVTSGRRSISLEGPLWMSVLEATGQPFSMLNNDPHGYAPGEGRRTHLPGYAEK